MLPKASGLEVQAAAAGLDLDSAAEARGPVSAGVVAVRAALAVEVERAADRDLAVAALLTRVCGAAEDRALVAPAEALERAGAAVVVVRAGALAVGVDWVVEAAPAALAVEVDRAGDRDLAAALAAQVPAEAAKDLEAAAAAELAAEAEAEAEAEASAPVAVAAVPVEEAALALRAEQDLVPAEALEGPEEEDLEEVALSVRFRVGAAKQAPQENG